jgi:hypothetical protein
LAFDVDFCSDGILHFGLYFSFQILSNVSKLNLPASRIFWFVVGSRGWAKGGDRAKSGRRSGRRASGLLGQTVFVHSRSNGQSWHHDFATPPKVAKSQGIKETTHGGFGDMGNEV